MADHRGVVVDHRSSESYDLLADFLTGRQEVCCDVGAKRVHIGFDLGDIRTKASDLGPNRFQVVLGRELGAHLAQKLKD